MWGAVRNVYPWNNPSPWVGAVCICGVVAWVGYEHQQVFRRQGEMRVKVRGMKKHSREIIRILTQKRAGKIQAGEAWHSLLDIETRVGGRKMMNAVLRSISLANAKRSKGRKLGGRVGKIITMDTIHRQMSAKVVTK